MAALRLCSKTACGQQSVVTLTYVYAEQTVVLGPLATYAEPHSYDLCQAHAERLTAPRGWDVMRLDFDQELPPDDLVALAEAVRERAVAPSSAPPPVSEPLQGIGRRGHLRVLRDR